MDDILDCPSRRGVLRSLAGIGVTTIAAGVLVACGTGGGTAADDAAGENTSGGAAGDDTGDDGATGGGTAGDDGATGGGTAGDGATGGGTAGDGATGGDAAGGDAAGADEASVPLADVPVGEAVVVDALGSRFVVAQPTAGEVVAFSAACTHQGTAVEAAGGLELLCPNHGSRFDAGDAGAVLNGPASAPLGQVQARIEGDLVLLSA
ncbi:ubiquinol-cytochrome c reductase iron-sulfur subunit [Jannaschia sp. R86511]|uniref:QcrA and Rieske domain-containing protein n=1 Tax=Jannaschia sp. R86511 TaxID=3093853 RepID=UPI0036D34A2B